MGIKRLTRIELPGLGTLRLDWTDDWERGLTTYRVDGPRVSGSVGVTLEMRRPEDSIDPDVPTVHICYGKGHPDDYDGNREDPLTVNGIKLYSGSVVNADTMRQKRLGRYDVVVRRGTNWHNSRNAPDITTERAAAVVHGVVGHWLTRRENYALRLAAVRWNARTVAGRLAHDIRIKQEVVTKHQAELDRLVALRDQALANAEMPFSGHRPPSNG